jgi:hypothetical protein
VQEISNGLLIRMNIMSQITSTTTISEKLIFFWNILKVKPEKLVREKYTVDDWLIKELLDDNEMSLLAGELGLGIDNPSLVNAFKDAINRGKVIKVICGQRILTNTEHENNLYTFLKSIQADNLSFHSIDIEHAPLFHFCLNGHNVMIEKPHLPSEALDSKIKIYIISNSILWYYKLRIVFRNLSSFSKKVTSDLLLNNRKEMLEYEKNISFLEYKKRILSTRQVHNTLSYAM